MKVVILAGGYGTRISEESYLKPKPMIEIGGKPVLWHIMKIYSYYGINDFIICLGYKGYIIKEYFSNYFLHMSDVTYCMEENRMEIHQKYAEPWKVTLVDTGENTMTGGRLKRIHKFVGDKTFCFTYGDGLADLNINALVEFHGKHGKKATITAIQPPGRFGALNLDISNKVSHFKEKPMGDGGWVNGGFFILEPEVFNYIEDDSTIWEEAPLRQLASEQELHAYQHKGFWHAMDTLRDKNVLEDYWKQKNPPWKLWK